VNSDGTLEIELTTLGRLLPEVHVPKWQPRVPAGLAALRWLVPTAAFELLRDFEPRYPGQPALRAMIEAAGFEVLEERDAFLAGLCRLVWARAKR
jgi:hypothetical protein